MSHGRIGTLAEIAEQSVSPADFWLHLRDFLDGFYRLPRHTALTDEPKPLAGSKINGDRLDAYLAAVAEHLAREFRFSIPPWTCKASRKLKEPFFAFQTFEGRMFLLVESPTAFRSRNIFVSADALSRV